MTEGWIKIHRQIEDNDLWFREKFTSGQAWIDMLIMANHNKNTFRVRGIDITIDRGQIGRGIRSISDRWQWSHTKTMRFLKELEERDMIERKISNVVQVITIKNYDSYQSNETQNDTQNGTQTALQNGTQNERNKKDKNVKNEKKRTSVSHETKSAYEFIDKQCQRLGLNNKINIKTFDLVMERHVSHIRTKVESQKCLIWLSDKKLKDISTQRISNWFEKARQIQTQDKLKALERKEEQFNPGFKASKQKIAEPDSIQHFTDSQK